MKKTTTTTAIKSEQVKQNEELAKQLILKRVNKDTQKDNFSDESFDQYNEKETILDMVTKLPFRRFISKNREISDYQKRFPLIYYRELYRLTGLQPDPNFPNRRPSIFAKHTLDIVYKAFPDGMISYLHENNPQDLYGFRMYKHFQLLSNVGVAKLEQIIKTAVRIMRQAKYLDHFFRLYSKELGSTYQLDMFDEE